MIKVGITGGIGAGKSLVCRIFKMLSIAVYDADYFAKYLMQNDTKLIEAIKSTFGEEIYSGTILNRQALAAIVFTDKERLNELNSLVHPAVFQHAANWFAKQSGAPYAIKEAALLFETGSYQALDINILVTAPKSTRISRVTKRDQTDTESVKSRMAKQWKDDQKKALADYCIINDDSEAIIPQINLIHQKILKMKKV